jgi:hypothetical protein
MEACYRGTDVMERSCAVARGIDINNITITPERTLASVWEWPLELLGGSICSLLIYCILYNRVSRLRQRAWL